jgi:hypothetical protein
MRLLQLRKITHFILNHTFQLLVDRINKSNSLHPALSIGDDRRGIIPSITLCSPDKKPRNAIPSDHSHNRYIPPVLRPLLDVLCIPLHQPRRTHKDIILSASLSLRCNQIMVIVLIYHVALTHQQPHHAMHVDPRLRDAERLHDDDFRCLEIFHDADDVRNRVGHEARGCDYCCERAVVCPWGAEGDDDNVGVAGREGFANVFRVQGCADDDFEASVDFRLHWSWLAD